MALFRFCRKADDEDAGQAGADEDGQCDDAHGRWRIEAPPGKIRLASIDIECAYFCKPRMISHSLVVSTAFSARCEEKQQHAEERNKKRATGDDAECPVTDHFVANES